MHLVDEVHLVATTGRCVRDVLQQFAGLIDLGARGGVHFDEVKKPSGVNVTAGGALAAGAGAHASLAIEAFGKDARDGGFTHATGAGKEVGMVQAVFVERVGERAQDMLLTDHVLKTVWTPLAG